MSTSLALARLELRRGWKSLVPIALLVAAVGAIVLWSFAAARRTETAFDRMLEATEAFDVLVNPDTGAETDLTTADLLTVDGVADASRVEAVGAFPPEADTVEEMFDTPGTIFATDGGSGYRLARPIIVDGRMPHADRADEIIADVEFAEIHDVDVGEALQLRFLTATNAAELLAVDEWAISEEPDEAEVEAAFAALIDRTDFAPVRELRVTGIGRWPDEVVVDDGFEQPAAMVTPALFDELGRPALFFGGWHVRLDDPSQISQFRRDVDAIVPDEFIVYQTMENVEAKAEKATSTPGGVMTIFAIVVLVLGTLLIGQSVQRWLDGRAVQLTLVRALGGSRSALGWSVTTQVGVAAVSGVVAGALVAVGASPLAPVGPARLVEVERGFQVDWFVLGFGMVGLGVLIIGASVIGWHATRRNASPNSPSRPSRSAWLRNVGMPLPVTTGVHFALDPVPGRRTSSRLAIVGVLTGVTLAVAALVFTASIERVASTPRLYGTNWSALVSFNGEFPDSTDVDEAYETAIQTIAEAPTVRGVSAVHAGELDVDGTRLPAIAFSDSSAPIGSTLAEGRLPVAPGEIALGRTTLRRLGVDIGDHVSLTTAAGPLDAEVVGRVVLPAIGDGIVTGS